MNALQYIPIVPAASVTTGFLPPAELVESGSGSPIVIEHMDLHIHSSSSPEKAGLTGGILTMVPIRSVPGHNLRAPLSCIVEPDGEGWLATAVDIPDLYGFGDTARDAVEFLRGEIASLYRDLHEVGVEYDSRWTEVRAFLDRLVES